MLATTRVHKTVMASIGRPLSGRRIKREILEGALQTGKSEFIALYGRRRVGKTFLIRRFFQDKSVLYFEMIGRFQATLDEHVAIFAESLRKALGNTAANDRPATWHAAFRALQAAIEKHRTSKRNEKFVLFFDELPWIASHRSCCLHELEHFWILGVRRETTSS